MSRLRQPADEGRLRLGIAVFFLLLCVPVTWLVWRAWQQLEFETFFDYQTRAARFTESVDRRLAAAVERMNRLGPGDFSFYSDTGIDGLVERSPLALWPVEPLLPGVLGYFELGPESGFSTPLLPPDDAGQPAIDSGELAERRELADDLRRILYDTASPRVAISSVDDDATRLPGAQLEAGLRLRTQSQELTSADIVPESEPVVAFDQLLEEAQSPRRDEATESSSAGQAAQTYGKLGDLQLDQRLQKKSEQVQMPNAEREARIAPAAAPAESAAADTAASAGSSNEGDAVALPRFAGDIEPFRFEWLGDGYAVLYRNLWIDSTRRVQAALIDTSRFLNESIVSEFRRSELGTMSSLVIGYGEDVVEIVGDAGQPQYDASASQLSGSLLYRASLSPPFQGLEVVLSVEDLPAGPGAGVLAATLAAFAAIAIAGFVLLYRGGLRQIRLARQQRDFVSAVSHELKTPLTSIRMYAEMLRAGWSDETRRSQYYDYIHDESERLTRLIDNVLQLSRMSRGDADVSVEEIAVTELADLLRSRLGDRVAGAGFEFNVECAGDAAGTRALVDPDAFLQIAINLVDNAIKFSGDADKRRIECRFARQDDEQIEFRVRDFGPGVPVSRIDRIFELFYRPESSVSRANGGTGIGLAIVRRLAEAMDGAAAVVNRRPGAEFIVSLPLRDR